jgi:hypothetical protein
MNVRYVVTLSADERRELEALVSGGAKPVRVAKRAQILLASADGETDALISKLVRVGMSTVYRTKRRCVEEDIEEALHERPRPAEPASSRPNRKRCSSRPRARRPRVVGPAGRCSCWPTR